MVMKIILYKFCSLESKRHLQYVRNIIVNRELFFSDPATFNDPYDCNIGLHLRVHLKTCGVLCFSTSNCDMILMFSHYADRHRGVCLQFEIDDDDTNDEISPFFGRRVDYQKKIPIFNSSNDAHTTLLTKYKKWKYEQEYRIFKVVKSDDERIMKYKLGQLKGAIFGLHISTDDSLLVRHWFELGNHDNVFFKQSQLSEDGFAINFIDA